MVTSNITKKPEGIYYTTKNGTQQLLDAKTLYSFAHDIIRKYGKERLPPDVIEDFVQSMVTYGIYAMSRWDPTRSCNVSTFLYNCMWNDLMRCLYRWFRDHKRQVTNLNDFEEWVKDFVDNKGNVYG